jgi:anti-sigma regulatory factor (Ser/Thr protein kinase)
MALEIVTEAVSNAVRHGGATQVSAAMSCEGDRTTLIVQDNGQEATSGAPGLGTRVLESCALEWSRDRIPGGAILRAVLPASTA